ncbi:MAG: cell division protein FtsH [Parcubacteria group bacterium CG11_big_fil_rev_8_21_14_0_20_48_46]|nr:MAG: cell division protein FtsH [Parcubacteria group bacterium CG11_big_fil_rev_8_21_14_0_20_48_46]
MKAILKNFLLLLAVFLIIAGIFSTFTLTASEKREVTLSALVDQVEREEVQSIVVKGDLLEVTLRDGTLEIARKESAESLAAVFDHYGVAKEKLSANKLTMDVQKESGLAFWAAAILPFLIPLLIFAGFIFFMSRQIQGANSRAMTFGQSGARESKKEEGQTVTFKDVAGVKEAKTELAEVVEFLKDAKKFLAIGAKIPKGVLLMGSPGTGKTLLARATAGEASVPFFHISGSEFVEMFVGVGASRVRDLFRKAKKSSPCIVFIDEIDAVGRQRGAGLGGGHDEREQTLNQILVEMDGFEPNVNVIVMAATNRPDVLDPALLRPGRFDRRVVLDEPDIADREAILRVHAKKKPLARDVKLRTIATRTPGFSGADLENVLNEAAILAARNNRKEIAMNDILTSIEKVMLGPERRSRVISQKEKKIVAYHEGGHALVAHFLPDADPVQKVSVISRGRAMGYTLKLPMEDKHLHSKAELLADLAVALGGYVTEKEIFGTEALTTGASNDLQTVTSIARALVTQYGMSDLLGARTFGQRDEMIFLGREIHERRDYSEDVAKQIDTEIHRLIGDAEAVALTLIRTHREKLELIVAVLLEKETLEKEEFDRLMEGKQLGADKTSGEKKGTIQQPPLAAKKSVPQPA